MNPEQHFKSLIANALGSEILARLELETQLHFASSRLEELQKEKETKEPAADA